MLKNLMREYESPLCVSLSFNESLSCSTILVLSLNFSHLSHSKILSYIYCDKCLGHSHIHASGDGLATRCNHEWITLILMRTKRIKSLPLRRRIFQGSGTENSDKIWLHCTYFLCVFKRGKILAF